MSHGNQQINNTWFKAITTPIEITEATKVIGFSLQVVSGTCTVQGGGKFAGQDSDPITLSEGQVYTEMASAGGVLAGYVITPTGTTNLSIKK